MATVVLKVLFPPGTIGVKFKTMKCKQTWTSKECIEEIIKSNPGLLTQSPDEYVLYVNKNVSTGEATWFDEDKHMSSFGLQDKDSVEMRKKYQVIRVRYRGAKQRILMHVDQPLSSTLPHIAKRFQLEGLQDYVLSARNKQLDFSKSVREQHISTDVVFVLRNVKEDMEEDVNEEDDVIKKIDDEVEIVAAPVEVEKPAPQIDLQGPAKSIMEPTKTGTLQYKSSRKKKFESRYMVLKDRYLFQYKAPTDKKPQGVIEVDKCTRRLFEGDEKEKKSKEFMKEYLFTFELFNDNEQYILKCETEQELKSWMGVLESTVATLTNSNKKHVFGATLRQVVKPGKQVPEIVEQCINYINERALDVVGIFRLSGSSVQIEEYQRAYDKGVKVDLTKEADPHCVSGLLKLYFRELPEPVLTYELYDSFISVQSLPDNNLRLRYIKNLLGRLPPINYNVLKYLMNFLRKVQAHSANNKMAIHNLATVFGPNLLTPPSGDTFQMIQDTAFVNGIVNSLIQDYDFFFTDNVADEYGIALYDFVGQDTSELTFNKNDRIVIITKGDETSWWTGQINGRIGRFPGSYIKIEVKSKKQQFLEEMSNLKKKLQEEQLAIEKLEESKILLEKETEEVSTEKVNYQSEIDELKQEIITILLDNKLDFFLGKFEKYYSKLAACAETRQKMDQLKKSVVTDLVEMTQFLKSPPEKEKKNIKAKSQEKIESLVGILQVKLNAEQKRRNLVNEAFDDLFKDCSAFIELLRTS